MGFSVEFGLGVVSHPVGDRWGKKVPSTFTPQFPFPVSICKFTDERKSHPSGEIQRKREIFYERYSSKYVSPCLGKFKSPFFSVRNMIKVPTPLYPMLSDN